LLVDAREHLLADLQQVERHQQLVDGDQLGAFLAVEVGLGLLAGKGVAAMWRLVAPVSPDRIGVQEADALEADQRRVLGNDAVPVPEPAAPPGVRAGARSAFGSGHRSGV
jgi:hypothetical protein